MKLRIGINLKGLHCEIKRLESGKIDGAFISTRIATCFLILLNLCLVYLKEVRSFNPLDTEIELLANRLGRCRYGILIS
jgi:hypothetical protein